MKNKHNWFTFILIGVLLLLVIAERNVHSESLSAIIYILTFLLLGNRIIQESTDAYRVYQKEKRIDWMALLLNAVLLVLIGITLFRMTRIYFV